MKKRLPPKTGRQVEDKSAQVAKPDNDKSQISSIPDDGHQALTRHLSTALGIGGLRFADGLVDQIVKLCADGAHFDHDRYKFIVALLVASKATEP